MLKSLKSALLSLEENQEILKDKLLELKADVAYTTYSFTKFNAFKLQVQNDDLISLKLLLSKIVTLWKQNFALKEYSQFPILWDLHKKNEISFDDTQVYYQQLESLCKDFTESFKYILSLNVNQ